MHWGRHNYWKGSINLATYDPQALYHVFDDLVSFKDFHFKLWMGGDNFTAVGKYRRAQQIIGGRPCIVLANRLVWVHEADVDWWRANTVTVYINDRMYVI